MENLELKYFGDAGLTVKFAGKLNLETAVQYGNTITDAVEDNDINELVLDFEQIDYISSIGIRVILELSRKMAAPKTITLINAGKQVSEALHMTGIDKFLTMK